MIESRIDESWPTRSLSESLKAAKKYVYQVQNLCSTPEIGSKIIQWVQASPETLKQFENEIGRVYTLCLDRARSTQSRKSSETNRVLPSLVMDRLNGLSSENWRILSNRKLRDEISNKVYCVIAWDGANAIGPSRIASRLGLAPKGIDAWIFLAEQFSSKSIDEFGSREDLAMIGLASKSVAGALPSDDRLLRELMNIIVGFKNTPDQPIPLPSKGPDGVDQVAASTARESARVFNEQFRLSDCGHLQTGFYGRERLGMYGREPVSWFRPMTVEQKLEPYPSLLHSEDDPEKIIASMERQKNYLIDKLRETLPSKSTIPIVKRTMTGNLELDEVRLLCKSCSLTFKVVYEFPDDPPFRGLEFVFKAFTEQLAKELQSNADFNEMLGVGVISSSRGNFIVMMDPEAQPAANIAALEPKFVIVVCNFFRGRWRERSLLVREVFGFSAGKNSSRWTETDERPDDARVAVFKAVSNYLVPTLAYDCENDACETMGIASANREVSMIPPRSNGVT